MYWQVAGLFALEDSVDITNRLAVLIDSIWPV